jgi:succinoglycan biosynthesis protein ExoA
LTPLVSVIIPARNEESDIGGAIESVLAQEHPPELLEVIVVDGGSSDGTVAAATAALADSEVELFRYLVVAGRGSTPANLNDGLAEASGQVLIRVDARSRIPPGYVARCVEVLRSRTDVAVVGGVQMAVARDDTARDLGIARALNNRFAMGLSRYRRGAPTGPADTVYLGAFRTTELRAIDGWNEDFPTNQDFELNRRMSATGIVWFDSDLLVEYLPRQELIDLFRQYRRFGQWKVRYWRLTGDRPQPRQLALLTLPVVGLFGGAWVALHRPRTLIDGIPALIGLGLLVEASGTTAPRGGLASRLVSCAAMASTSGGWLFGVVSEGVRRSD